MQQQESCHVKKKGKKTKAAKGNKIDRAETSNKRSKTNQPTNQHTTIRSLDVDGGGDVLGVEVLVGEGDVVRGELGVAFVDGLGDVG